MKAKPLKFDPENLTYTPCLPNEATHIKLNVPGCFPLRMLPLSGKPSWQWNLDCESPTVTPSIKSTDGHQICHFTLANGLVTFCSDTTHEFSGQTVPLLDCDGQYEK